MGDGTQSKDHGKESQRAEVLSSAVAANMGRKKYLHIAQAMQPVAACAWAVVDGLATEADLHGEAVAALHKLELHVKVFAERKLLSQVAADTYECMQEEAALAAALAGEGVAPEAADQAPPMPAMPEEVTP